MQLAETNGLAITLPQLLLAVGLVVAAIVVFGMLYFKATSKNESYGRRRSWFAQMIYMVFIALIGILAATSFGSIVRFGHMSSDALFVHVAAAGAFVFALTGMAFLFLPAGIDDPIDYDIRDFRWWASRWLGRVLIVSSLATAASMLISMLPWLGTDSLRTMVVVHRYTGLLTVAAAILHGFSLLCIHFRWR